MTQKITSENRDKDNIDELKNIVAETLRFSPEFVVHYTYREGCYPDSLFTDITCEE